MKKALSRLLSKTRSPLSDEDSRILSEMLDEECQIFSGIGLTSDSLEKECHSILKSIDCDLPAPLSTHLLVFLALKKSGFLPKNVLELGTFHGKTTRFLATLFPEATIHTVDLPSDDPIAMKFSKLIDTEKEQLKSRLSKSNIRSYHSNTVWLPSLKIPACDLIWVDAWHKFPEVAWDHMYSFNNLNPDGWLLSDDIWTPNSNWSKEDFTNLDAFQTLCYFHKRMKSPIRLLPKRIDQNGRRIGEKYIAYYRHSGA